MFLLIPLSAGLAAAAPPPEGWSGEANADLASRAEQTSPLLLDADGTTLETTPTLDGQLIVGGRAQYRGPSLLVRADVEGGVTTGTLTGRADETIADGLPRTDDMTTTLRKANLVLSLGPALTLGGGWMTSRWGLGLLANDGTGRWRSGTAQFTDPRGGDVVLRGLVSTGPHASLQHLRATVFVDQVTEDASLLEGDEAWQAGGALTIGKVGPKKPHAGLYVVKRFVTTASADTLDALVFDVMGSLPHDLGEGRKVTVAGEFAVVTGETTLGPSTDHPTHDLLQLGGALRASFDDGPRGAVLDVFYAAGDRNSSDGTLHAFRIDSNYPAGLMLYRQLLTAQTARSVVVASDLDLTGVPAEDLDRIPTRGSVSNTVAVFPRAWVRPMDALEIYGGPLLAWNEVEYADPLQSKLNGGVPTNPFGTEPGRYLGTELDLGLRLSAELGPATTSLGLEGGVLLPGSALALADDASMDTVYGGRALWTLSY